MSREKNIFFKSCYTVSFLFLIAWIITCFLTTGPGTGWLLAGAFTLLAIALRGNRKLKGYWYSIAILGVATLAMYYPQWFRTIGTREASFFIPFMLQLIMFGMGTELSLKEFADVMKMPKGVIVGIVCHYTIMPLVGLVIANLFHFHGEIAAGIILIGCCPSGLASNVMCYLAKANLALSVSVTAVSTLLAPILTPLLMKLLAGSYVTVDFWKMFRDIIKIVILPIAAGLIFHYAARGKIKWVDKAMPIVSMTGIALVLLVITAAGRDNLLKVGGLLIAATFLHNMLGYFLGYWSARVLKFPEKDCRTIALEVGMQNAGLASALAKMLGKIATIGLASVIFGTMMNVSGSFLANWWHNREPTGDNKG